jgi:sec-independent protein translocase protein TatC
MILKKDQISDEKEMGFFDHIDELRKHLFRSVLTVVVFATIALFNSKFVFDKLLFGPVKSDFITYRVLCSLSNKIRPLLCDLSSFLCPQEGLCFKDINITFLNTALFGQFIAQLQICILLAFIFAFPVCVFEVWRFVKPALSETEAKKSGRVILFSSLFFAAGVLFAYFLIIPFSLSFATSYVVSDQIENRFTFDNYVGFVSIMLLASGVVFELPMVVYLLAKMGLLTASFMQQFRRHAFVVILIVAAVITPSPDMFTMMVVAVPIYFLYEISILLAKRINP